MTAYNMVSLYGEKEVEIYGTDGTTYDTNTSFVFTAFASLKIQQLVDGQPTGTVIEDQPLFDSNIKDGPGKFAAEINVAGNLVYGYVWDLPTNNIPAGTYRITFTLNSPSNVIIGNVAVPDEGEPRTFPVLDSPTQVHIDVTIHPASLL